MNIEQTVIQFLLLCFSFVNSEHLLQSLTASVEANNYTHYKLSTQGRLRMVLESTTGDADLYISDTTLSPTCDDYSIQANSCGKEEVEIPSGMKRPVGIGVFGHPNHEVSQYKLSIYFIAQNDDADYAELSRLYNIIDSEEVNSDEFGDSSTQYSNRLHGTSEEEGETVWSVLGTILSTVLKIVFEILL